MGILILPGHGPTLVPSPDETCSSFVCYPLSLICRVPKKRIGGSGTFTGIGKQGFVSLVIMPVALIAPSCDPAWSAVTPHPSSLPAIHMPRAKETYRWLWDVHRHEDSIPHFFPEAGFGTSVGTINMPWILHLHIWAAGLLCPFFTHLSLLALSALVGLLVRPFRAHGTPLGGLVLLPSRGVPLNFLRPIAAFSVRLRDGQNGSAQVALTRSRRGGRHQYPRACRGVGPFWSGWSLSLLGFSTPCQVWAAPAGLREAVGDMQRAAEMLPAPLARSSVGYANADASSVRAGSRFAQLSPVLQQDFDHLHEDADDIPIPPLHPQATDTGSLPEIEGVCLALAPQYQAEVLRLALHLPLDSAAFNRAVKAAIHRLQLPFCFVVAPTVPQLGPDFASIVLVPKWLPQNGRQVIVYDFRTLGGPVYASFVFETVTHQECLQEAVSQGFPRCSIYVQGHSRALQTGDTFLAALGGVIQFQPEDQAASWSCTLAARFDRPQWWVPHPQLPPQGTDRPVLVLFHDQHMLYSAARFPGVPTLRYLAELVHRSPERVLFVSPVGSELANVDCRGISCRDALAIYPLVPSAARTGILVFLDARQAGQGITHIYLEDADADPRAIIRFLALRPPPCYRVAMLPRPGRSGVLHLSEGDVVVVGFKEDHPWSTDEDGSDASDDSDLQGPASSGESANGAGAAQDTQPPQGPPVPMPVGERRLRASPSGRSTARSRSRSPHASSGSAHVTGTGTALARSALGTALGISQFGSATGYLVFDSNTAHWPGVRSVPSPCSRVLAIVAGALFAIAGAYWVCLYLYSRRVRTCKILQEPVGSSPAETSTLRALRRATRLLGGRWITDSPLRHMGFLPAVQEDDTVSDAEESSEDSIVSCAILRPDYIAETLHVTLPLPATPAELETAVQQARRPDVAVLFPGVLSVLPQPPLGIATFLALPACPVGGVLICVDTTAIDGRLFAVCAPSYVCHGDLVLLVGLLDHVEYDIFYNVDQELIGDRSVHLFPGALVTFLYADSLWPAQPDLGELLQSRTAWGTPVTLPAPAFADAYCLVFRGVASLCVDVSGVPFRYREHIARVSGADPHLMRLFAASPGVRDAAVRGVSCPTVLAIGQPRSGFPREVWHCALLDCRAFAAPWVELRVHQGSIPQRAIFASLECTTPPGWTLQLDGRFEAPGQLWLAPGQVVVATLVPSRLAPRDAHPIAALQHAPTAEGRPPASPGPASAQLQGTLDSGRSPNRCDDPGAGSPQSDSPDVDTEDVQESCLSLDARGILLTFLVFAPDYTHETVEARLHLPCNLHHAMQQVQSARHQAPRQWFPRLTPASHQHLSGCGIALAHPQWEPSGVIILIENGLDAGRLFAAVAPPLAQRHLLLALIGARATSDLHVYVRDMPWPLQDHTTIPLATGDFVSFQPAAQELEVLTSLPDMLQDAANWRSPLSDAVPGPEYLWLLNDEWPRSFRFDRNRRALLHRDVAGLLHVPPQGLKNTPCRPGIRAFSVQGYVISAAVIATSVGIRLTDDGTGLFPYVLDMRPLLRGLEWGPILKDTSTCDVLLRDSGRDAPPAFACECRVVSQSPLPFSTSFGLVQGMFLFFHLSLRPLASGPMKALAMG